MSSKKVKGKKKDSVLEQIGIYKQNCGVCGNMPVRGICGIEQEIHYDRKVEKIDVDLVHVGGSVKTADGYRMLVFTDISAKNPDRHKHLFQLHIKEAIQLKSLLDELIYDSIAEEDMDLYKEIKEAKK